MSIRVTTPVGLGPRLRRCVVLLSILSFAVNAQVGSWKTYNANDGLIHNVVRAFYQDSKGYLWIGTQGGVSRFDGDEFKNFNVKDSIAAAEVSSILEDNAGSMWFLAKSAVKRYDGVTVRGVTTKDGLADNSVSAMLKDHRGRIWFATSKGICRFEGASIQRVLEQDVSAGRQITLMREDSRGRVWAAFKSGGLGYLDSTVFPRSSWTTFSVPEGLPSDLVQDIREDRSGTIWAATNAGLARYDGVGFTAATFNELLSSKIVYSVVVDHEGNLWFRLAARGVARWDGLHLHMFTQGEGLAGNFVNDMMVDREGRVWVATSAGVSKIENGVIENFHKDAGLVSDFVKNLFQDHEGGMWFGTTNGITHVVEPQFRTFLKEDLEAVPRYRPMAYADDAKNLWFPCAEGLAFTDGKEFRVFTKRDGLLDASVDGITFDAPGRMILRFRTGLQFLENKNFKTVDDPLVKDRGFLHCIRDTRGNTWLVRNDSKIIILKNGLFSRFEKGAFAGSRFNIESVACDSLGNVWFMSSGGPIRCNENDAQYFRIGEIAAGISTYDAFTETRDGSAWFATAKGLFRFDGTQFRKVGMKEGMNEGGVPMMFIGRNGNFYPIVHRTDSTGRDVPLGVVRTDGRSFRLFTTADGLPSNDVRNVYEEPCGFVWFITDRGVSRFDGTSMQSFASAVNLAGADWSVSTNDSAGNVWIATNAGVSKFNGRYFTTYSTRNAMLSNEVIRLALDPLNQLWIRSSRGIQKYVPRDIRPLINIASVSAGPVAYAADRPRQFSYKENNIVFDFRGINFSTGSDMLQYIYRLEGYDTTWYGPVKERKALYHNLSPGDYKFQVKAINVDLGESVVPAEFSFVITPPFYVTWWFRSSTSLTLLVVGYVTYRRRLKAKLERERMLSELRAAHDMQMGLMPAKDPDVQGFDISGMCKPATEVGGDYFDYVWLDGEKKRFGIAVADVSGKAMKAAITAVMTSGMVYREIGGNDTPRSIMRKINRPMYFKTDRRVFTAMLFASIDVESKILTFSNAGQTSPALKRGNDVQYLKMEGLRFPLGMKEDVEYGEMTVQLQSGDVLAFFTDGLTEEMNEAEEVFGFERIAETMSRLHDGRSAREIVALLFDEAQRYAGKATQHDDMTVVVVRVL